MTLAGPPTVEAAAGAPHCLCNTVNCDRSVSTSLEYADDRGDDFPIYPRIAQRYFRNRLEIASK